MIKKITLVDTHTHIHDAEFFNQDNEKIREILINSAANGIKKMMLVGTSLEDSKNAVFFAKKWKKFGNENGIEFAVALGIHPHESDPKLERNIESQISAFEIFAKKTVEEGIVKVAAIGEIGLDYFYDFEFRERQMELLRGQLKVAKKLSLPVNFHVRDFRKPDTEKSVWKDFWKVFEEDNFSDFGIKIPVIFHSYTEQSRENLAKILKFPNAYFGVNGISTFAKNSERDLWKNEIPLSKILFETDAPFLSPAGFRGKVNEPARIFTIAENLAKIREKSLEEIAKTTTKNAENALSF